MLLPKGNNLNCLGKRLSCVTIHSDFLVSRFFIHQEACYGFNRKESALIHYGFTMWLKIIILILFIGVLLSLTAGLTFLLRDAGVSNKKRTLYALGIRIALASLMMACVVYGFYSGILTSTAPWDQQLR